MFGRKVYSDGLKEGRLQTISEFERVVALLREELQDVRRDRDLQMQRADAAADLLLQHLGTRAISLAGKQEEVAKQERHARNVGALSHVVDPTEELPYGHPLSTFKSAKDASLFNGEDAGAEG